MKQKLSGRDVAIKTVLLFIATFISAVSVAMLILGQMGSDSLSVWLDGLTKTIHIPLEKASLYTNIALLVLAFIFAFKNVNIGTFIGSIGFSFCLGIVKPFVINLLGESPTVTVRVILTVLSVLIMGISCGLTVSLRMGFGATDCLLFRVHEKSNIPYRYLKIGMDGFYLVVGFLFGGIVGFGTVLSMFATGPLIEVFAKKFDSTLLKALRMQDPRNQFEKVGEAGGQSGGAEETELLNSDIPPIAVEPKRAE